MSEDLTSAALMALVVRALERRHRELLPPGLGGTAALDRAQVPAEDKTAVLVHVYEQAGPEVLVELLSDVSEFGFTPMLAVLLRAPTPSAAMQRWLRLERYGHTRHRLRQIEAGDGWVELERYATRGPAPRKEHDLLILGLVTGLLRAVGATGLTVTLAGVPVIEADRTLPGAIGPDLSTKRWHIAWAAEDGPRQRPPDRAEDQAAVRLQIRGAGHPVIDRAVEVVASDLVRTWTVAEVARACAVSSRTLQRRLGDSDLTFSRILRAVRVKRACQMIAETQASLTEVGFACGFTDSAHFTREFKRTTGATPSQYRSALADGP